MDQSFREGGKARSYGVLAAGHPAGEPDFQAEGGEGGEDQAVPDLVAAGPVDGEEAVGQAGGVGVEGEGPAPGQDLGLGGLQRGGVGLAVVAGDGGVERSLRAGRAGPGGRSRARSVSAWRTRAASAGPEDGQLDLAAGGGGQRQGRDVGRRGRVEVEGQGLAGLDRPGPLGPGGEVGDQLVGPGDEVGVDRQGPPLGVDRPGQEGDPPLAVADARRSRGRRCRAGPRPRRRGRAPGPGRRTGRPRRARGPRPGRAGRAPGRRRSGGRGGRRRLASTGRP